MNNSNLVLMALPMPVFPCNKKISRQIIDHLERSGLRIQKKIGSGAQGNVYALENITTGIVTSVLKIMKDSKTSYNPSEASHLVAKIQHPGICSPTQFFYQTFFNNVSLTPSLGSVCVATVMPYIEGCSLYEDIDTLRKQTEQLFPFLLVLSQAILELSKNQLEHNDLADLNILIDKNKNPVIIDFDRCKKNHHLIPLSDYSCLLDIVKRMIQKSPDINPNAKKFLLSCSQKCDNILKEIIQTSKQKGVDLRKGKKDIHPQLPELMVSFMQACIDHLSEIKAHHPTPRLSKL